jgi:hypothetical protein
MATLYRLPIGQDDPNTHYAFYEAFMPNSQSGVALSGDVANNRSERHGLGHVRIVRCRYL